MADTPIAFNQQVIDPTTAWVCFGFGAAGFAAFLLLAAISLSRRKGNRPRTYRSTFLATIAFLLISGFYAIRSYGYVNQTVIAWDSSTAIQGGGWDFGVNGLALVFLGVLIKSYAPSGDVLDMKKKSNKQDEGGNPESSAVINKESEDLAFSKNVHHWVPGHALLGGIFAAGVFAALALQQGFPFALIPIYCVGFVALVALVAYYAIIVMIVGSIPGKIAASGTDKKNKKSETRVYRALMAFLLTFMIVSISGMIVAAGISPAVATLQTTFSINASSWVMMGTTTLCGLIAFFAVLYFDFWHEESGKGKVT